MSVSVVDLAGLGSTIDWATLSSFVEIPCLLHSSIMCISQTWPPGANRDSFQCSSAPVTLSPRNCKGEAVHRRNKELSALVAKSPVK